MDLLGKHFMFVKVEYIYGDPFYILGIQPTNDINKINKAYAKHMRTIIPRKNMPSEYTKYFKCVINAYHVAQYLCNH
jgi:hypothetical protein